MEGILNVYFVLASGGGARLTSRKDQKGIRPRSNTGRAQQIALQSVHLIIRHLVCSLDVFA